MKKSEMISVNGQYDFSFEYMGCFIGEPGWIHPPFTLKTTELIFVTDGVVHIREEGKEYSILPGELFFLAPETPHAGFRKSEVPTSFYWLHYRLSNPSALPLKKRYRPSDTYSYVNLFKQLNHLFLNGSTSLAETKLLAMLLELSAGANSENKLAYDVAEYIRVKIASAPDVQLVADRFQYSADHLSKIFAATFRIPLKRFIDRERLAYIKSLLLSTNLSLKQIAETAGFHEENHLIKFFKYHAGETPTSFRNSYFFSHLNDR